MTKEQLKQIRDILELDNLGLGKALGYTCTLYQCKQVDNLINGSTSIKPVVKLAVECLARQKNKLKDYKLIMNM